jgi:hypothetical protein
MDRWLLRPVGTDSGMLTGIRAQRRRVRKGNEMDRIEQDQSNEDPEVVLHATEDLTDEVLLRAADNEAGPKNGTWFGNPC